MTQISISIEGAGGLNWSRWQRLVQTVESLGFSGMFCSDHFISPGGSVTDSLELIVALTYLADHSERIHFGSMVAPLSFRDPAMLARQAAAIDNLSGGRLVLGLGAGWFEQEHTMFGYDLGDIGTRMDRLEEGLTVLTGLLRCEEPFSFNGRFFQLHEAYQRPLPQREGGTRIMVGGSGPKRTLPIVARFADVWNGQVLTPDAFQERSDLLDGLLEREGRRLGEVKRTISLPVICFRDEAELERRVKHFRVIPFLADLTAAAVLESFSGMLTSTISGAPDRIIEQLQAYADAGAEELVVQWFGLDDIEGLEILASEVLPHFP
jgi:alkanesulfonate monooxygenase SsuD/methylene tetrahydromethanopterin reductase-like flavin-dependent oxidoreductase (luciferase family)